MVQEGGDAVNTTVAPHMFLTGTIASTGTIIKGESKKAGHEDEIEVLSWSWGVSNPINIGSSSGGAGAGKANFRELVITKYIDKSSPQLMQLLASGAHLQQATLVVANPTGLEDDSYYQIDMKLVIVASIDQSISNGEARPTEQVTLVFGAAQIEYGERDPLDGKVKEGPKEKFVWSIVRNAPEFETE